MATFAHRRTGQLALRSGVYLCSRGCGTLIKVDYGEPLPWCLYCFERVAWRYLSAGRTHDVEGPVEDRDEAAE